MCESSRSVASEAAVMKPDKVTDCKIKNKCIHDGDDGGAGR